MDRGESRKPGMEEKAEELDGLLKGNVEEVRHLLKLCRIFKRSMSMKWQSSGRPYEDLSFRWAEEKNAAVKA